MHCDRIGFRFTWPRNDPDFETKAADIIGLYLHPPPHAAVFCVDEKTAIQAFDREDPVLPLSSGRAERLGFEYYRHSTLSLCAAFNTKSGEVLGKTTVRYTSSEFVAFLSDFVTNQPRGKEIHCFCGEYLWFGILSKRKAAPGQVLKEKVRAFGTRFNDSGAI